MWYEAGSSQGDGGLSAAPVPNASFAPPPGPPPPRTRTHRRQASRTDALFDEMSAEEGAHGPEGATMINGFTDAAITAFGAEAVRSRFGSLKFGFMNLDPLKHYFNVSHSYVFNKLRLIFFPYRHRTWSRRPMAANPASDDWRGRSSPTSGEGSSPTYNASFLPPRDDINSPDLYLPLMAFTTYLVLTAFVLGRRFRFNPEFITRTATYGTLAVGFEVLLMKLSLYVLSCPQPVPLLDLVSYSGYKYVGVTFNVLIGIVLGRLSYNLSVLITSFAMATFLLKSFRTLFFVQQHGHFSPSQERLKQIVLLGFAILQWPLCWFLGPKSFIVSFLAD